MEQSDKKKMLRSVMPLGILRPVLDYILFFRLQIAIKSDLQDDFRGQLQDDFWPTSG